MKKFSSLGIEQPDRFVGQSIPIYDLLNKEIIVMNFKIVPSKFTDKGSGERLDLQISVDDVERVVWTGSTIMMDQIKMVNEADFPFTTTIVKLAPKGFKFT